MSEEAVNENGDTENGSGGEQSNAPTLDDLMATIKTYEKRLESIENHNSRLMDETKRAKEAKRMAEQEAAEKAGDFKKLWEAEKMKTAEYQKREEARSAKDKEDMVRSEAMKIAQKYADDYNVNILAKEILPSLQYTEDGVKVVDEHGNLSAIDLSEFGEKVASDPRYKSLVRGNQSSGGGATGSRNGVSGVKQMKRSQFAQLNAAQQAEFMLQQGGRLVD